MIELEDITAGYGKRVLLQDIRCRMRGGRLVALIGRNGTGKSTLLRVIAGLSAPLKGRVILQGRDMQKLSVAEKAHMLAFVTTERVRIANLRCRDVVALGRAPYTGWMGRLDASDEEIVERSLKSVSMDGYGSRTMDKMSDGECQRVMIARALAQDTPVILLDEPTSFLDLPNRYELCLLLRRLAHEQGKSIVFSTHELDIALSLCDDIALIDSPQLLYGTPQEMIDTKAVQRLFCTENMQFDPTTFTIKSK